MSHQETNWRVAPQRRKVDYPLHIKEEIRATEKLNAQKAGLDVSQSANGRWRWLSAFQEKIRANPVPYILIGSGLMIGGIAVMWDRRRRRSIIMRDFSDVSEEIRPTA